MLGILIVATEPLAARRRWCFPSLVWSEALKAGSRETSWAGWIACSILLLSLVNFGDQGGGCRILNGSMFLATWDSMKQ